MSIKERSFGLLYRVHRTMERERERERGDTLQLELETISVILPHNRRTSASTGNKFICIKMEIADFSETLQQTSCPTQCNNSKTTRTHVPTPPILHNTCEFSYPLNLLPPHCTQYTQVEYSCLLSFLFINLKMANEKCRNRKLLSM